MKSSRFTSASICALLFSLLLQTATCRSADAGQALSVKPAAMDLKSAILYAVEHAPALDSARKTRDIRELEYRNAVSKLLPSVDFKTVDGLQNNIPVSDNSLALLAANPSRPWYSSINLGVSETLYDNGKP